MVISLENGIIDLNDVRRYCALVDILLSGQLSDLRRTFEIQALVMFWRRDNSKHGDKKCTQKSFFSFHASPLLILSFCNFDVRIKTLWSFPEKTTPASLLLPQSLNLSS